MGSKYRYIDAVGQLNDMACWAASLKWWYKAVMSINASQEKLIDHYSGLKDSFGGMQDPAMKQIIRENAMTLIEYPIAANFVSDDIRWLLGYGPVYVAFTESGTMKKHVNVIYEIKGDESSYCEVRAMEPQDRDLGNGKWKGAHLKRPINHYNIVGSIWAGVSKKAFNKS